MRTATAPPVFFGWKVVATAFVVATFSFGIGYYGPAVFLNVLHHDRGWKLHIISAAITVHFLTSAILVTRLPAAHARFGIATITLGGIAALAIGMFGWSIADAPWQLFLASLLSGCGWAATNAAAIIAMVTPWFERRRALALGHALNGASLGGVLFAPFWIMLIGAVGFSAATAAVGVATLALLGPLAWRYLRPTPESLDLAPDGDGARPTQHARSPAASIRQLVFNQGFVTLSAAFALGMFAQVGVVAHLITRLAPQVGAIHAAMAVSLATACAVIGRVSLGALLADADRRFVAAGNFAMQASGVAMLAFGSTMPVLAVGCVLFGLGIGNLLTLPPLIAQKEFEAPDVPQVVALVTAVNQAVFAFAPTIIAIIAQTSGTYALAFLVAAGIQLVASVIVLLGRQPSCLGALAPD